MALKVIRYAEQPDMPWANNLGSARQLWADPPGERRISIARLNAPAPFSRLPGVARLLLVLDPIRITLRACGREVRLEQHETIGFSGSEPVELLEVNRPGRVLNLMALAERWSPHLSAPAPALGWVVLRENRHSGTLLQSGDLVFGAAPVPQAISVHFLPA